MWRKKVLPYFHYNKKERTGIIALLVILVLLWAIPFFFSEFPQKMIVPDMALLPGATTALEQQGANKQGGDSINILHTAVTGNSENEIDYDLFPFDPNTTTESEWKRLGLQPRTIKVLQNYIEKGGRFHRKEDLRKVYGLKADDYERLSPYVHINASPVFQHAKSSRHKYSTEKDTSLAFKPRSSSAKIDINKADIQTWETLPGIGDKLATRIVTFREKLGGFVRPEQVGETYGIDPELFTSILPKLVNEHSVAVKKIMLNKSSFDELKQHPYIGYRLARLVVAYREQHGDYKQANDLMNIPLVTTEVLDKLLPYIEL